MHCQVCSAKMTADRLEQTFRCGECDFYSSHFPVRINQVDTIDETARERALLSLRLQQFKQVLDKLEGRLTPEASLLDVGCAHGWFLRYARSRGYACSGIEPDGAMCARMRASGIDHIQGYFPRDLPDDSRYDAVFFNDVFEHLDGLPTALAAAHERTKTDGLLVISLPVSEGLFFRLARGLAGLGYKAPLSRLWQRGLPSPHLSYFSCANLPVLAERHGFTQVASGDLPYVTLSGLLDRIRYASQASSPAIILTWLCVLPIAAAAWWFPSDARYFIFRKQILRLGHLPE